MSEEISDIHPPTPSSTKNCGRLPGLYTYETVRNRDKDYAIITIRHKKNEVRFIIDSDHLTTVLTKPWHLSSGKYIATQYTLPNGKSKELSLHTFIKEKCMNETGDTVAVHINTNMLDNRSENLRIIKSSEYRPLRSNHKRTIVLPPGCGFTVDDIPKYVSYMKATGEHGDRFAIEIPQINLFLKLPSSKKRSLKDKFEETKAKLNEIYEKYPHIHPNSDDQVKLELNTSFQAILDSV